MLRIQPRCIREAGPSETANKRQQARQEERFSGMLATTTRQNGQAMGVGVESGRIKTAASSRAGDRLLTEHVELSVQNRSPRISITHASEPSCDLSDHRNILLSSKQPCIQISGSFRPVIFVPFRTSACIIQSLPSFPIFVTLEDRHAASCSAQTCCRTTQTSKV